MERCKACGEVITINKTCPTCHGLGVLCPDCGGRLSVMSTSTMFSETQFTLITMYNCAQCGADWERNATYIGEPVKFTRKIWG